MKHKRLVGKQLLFVLEFCADPDSNATGAARAAGYKWPNKVAERLMALPHVKAAIDSRKARLVQKFDLTETRVLAEISEIAFAALGDQNVSTGDKLIALEKAMKYLDLYPSVRHDHRFEEVEDGERALTDTERVQRFTVWLIRAETGGSGPEAPVGDPPMVTARD